MSSDLNALSCAARGDDAPVRVAFSDITECPADGRATRRPRHCFLVSDPLQNSHLPLFLHAISTERAAEPICTNGGVRWLAVIESQQSIVNAIVRSVE